MSHIDRGVHRISDSPVIVTYLPLHFNNRQFIDSIDWITQYNKKLPAPRDDTAKYTRCKTNFIKQVASRGFASASIIHTNTSYSIIEPHTFNVIRHC